MWQWIGWGISTLLLMFLNRRKSNSSDASSEPQPSKFTETNVNSIGSPVPVVIGRGLIKNPLISFYGDFRADPYTEEYGMHSKLDAKSLIWPILLAILAAIVTPNAVVTPSGPGTETTQGAKNSLIIMTIINALLMLLLMLFNNHSGRTTIQKGFKYYLGWQNIICWTGENFGLKTIYMNVYDSEVDSSTEQGVWNSGVSPAWKSDNINGLDVRIDNDEMFGGVDEGGGFIGNVRFYFGDSAQPKDPWMIRQMNISTSIPANLKGLTPKYPMYFTCDVSERDYQSGAYIGKQATVPEMWFEVVNYPDGLSKKFPGTFNPRIGDDSNPAEVIYEILMNKYWGCNYTDYKIDLSSLISLGIRCEQEGLGISCVINKVSQANEYITKILNHINGLRYDNPFTGKLTFKLIRSDFDIATLKVFDVSNTESCEFSRLDWSEAISSVSVNFTNAADKYDSSTYLYNDAANKVITQSYTVQDIDGEYFTTPENARWLAQTSMLSAGYPLSAINLVTDRYGYDVAVGDPIKVTWEPYGINQMVFRITDIDYATLTDGKISIAAIEDVFSFDKIDFAFSPTPQWTEPQKVPYDIARWLLYEEPYEESFSLDTYLYAYAAKPSSDTVYWNVWRNVNGSYTKTSSASTWSTVGRTIYGYDEDYPFDPTGFEFGYVGTEGRQLIENKINSIASNPQMYNHNSRLNLVILDNEIMSYDNIVRLPNGNYQLQGVIRGVFDTVPKPHTAESIMFFVEYRQNVNGVGVVALQGNTSAEEVELKTQSVTTEQPFNIFDVTNFLTTRRSEQPSIMANLQLGADKGTETLYMYGLPVSRMLSYDILFTFIGRNKFNNANILDQTDNITAIAVANTTKNVIQLSCNGENLEYMYDARDAADTFNITSMRLKWSDFCRDMAYKVSVLNTVVARIKTYDTNKNIYSYDEYEKAFNWAIPRLVGIVANVADAQTLADSYVQPSLNNITVPPTPVSPQQVLTMEDCALIFEGTPSTTSSIKGQDGNTYDITNIAHRIDGYTSSGTAIIHQIILDEEFIFRTDFTVASVNYSDYYRLRLGRYISYIPY